MPSRERGPEPLSLCGFLRQARARVLEEWATRARSLSPARDLDRRTLLDQFGQLLDALADHIEGFRLGVAPAPQQHALQRLSVGFGIADLAREYAILRSVVLELYAREQREWLGIEDLLRFERALDSAVTLSISRFKEARARVLESLERISSAALHCDDPNQLLHECLKVMFESTDAVDSAVVLLFDGERLRTRAAIGLLEDRDPGFSLALGEGFAGTIAKTRAPLHLRSAATDPIVKSDSIRTRGIRALYGVPLIEGGQLLGVAHIGSRSTQEFSEEDLFLFRQMASRASALLHQRQLRDRERVSLERAERAERRLRGILESIADGFMSFDARWRFSYVNPAALQMLERTEDQLRGKTLFEVLPRMVDPRAREALERTHEAHIPTVFEVQAEASGRWFELRAFPTPEGMSIYFHDVSERHLHEAERNRLLAENLSAGEILERGDPMVVLDPAFRVTRVNVGFEELFERRREAVLGGSFWEVFPALSDPTSSAWRALHAALEERRPVRFEQLHPPGDLWTSVSAYPTGEGGLAVFLRDISERRRSEQFQERLVGIVGHDLRNPLQAILMSTRVLMQRGELPDRALPGLLRIQHSADRMAQIINDLLDFTRARIGGGISVQPHPTELCGLARGVVEELEVAHPGRLRLQCEGDLHGEWDASRLGQVISNLLSNALTYGERHAPVQLELEGQRGSVQITVRNQGNPISPDVLPHIFDPFRRASGQRQDGLGLGLGLYIVQQIVLAHRGTIAVESGDHATAFVVRLPKGPPT